MKELTKKQKAIFGLLAVFVVICVLIFVIMTVETEWNLDGQGQAPVQTEENTGQDQSQGQEVGNQTSSAAGIDEEVPLVGISSLSQEWTILDTRDGICDIRFSYDSLNSDTVSLVLYSPEGSSIQGVSVSDVEGSMIELSNKATLDTVGNAAEQYGLRTDAYYSVSQEDDTHIRVDIVLDKVYESLRADVEIRQRSIVSDVEGAAQGSTAYESNAMARIDLPVYIDSTSDFVLADRFNISLYVVNVEGNVLNYIPKNANEVEVIYPTGEEWGSYAVSVAFKCDDNCSTVGEYYDNHIGEGYGYIETWREPYWSLEKLEGMEKEAQAYMGSETISSEE